MTTRRKVMRIGRVDTGAGRFVSLYVKAEYSKDGRLSMTGVEGPTPSGDARGGCGQIVMSPWPIKTYAPGWDAASVAQLRDIWEQWHLNDMRAGCEHQRANWGDVGRKVEIVTYKLTTEALRAQGRIKARVVEDAKAKGSIELLEEERELYALPYTTTQAPDADGAGSGRYEVSKREMEAIGWLRPEEHPEGLLCKPCEVCGYKYGSAWLREEVPADVIEWLFSRPDTDTQPAWV